MVKGKTRFTSSTKPYRRGGGLPSRILIYIIIGVVIPFILKRIRNQVVRDQFLRCEQCNRKMQMINRNEFYCKYCKIIRLDDRWHVLTLSLFKIAVKEVTEHCILIGPEIDSCHSFQCVIFYFLPSCYQFTSWDNLH